MKVLILFTQESIDGLRAYPERLRQLLETQSDGTITVDTAVYDDLAYTLKASGSSIRVTTTGLDVAEYDLVYLRRIKEATAQAITVGKYCQARDVAVIDTEIASRPGSMGKLTQYMQFSLAGLPFPDTVYSSSHTVLVEAFDTSGMTFPIIVKSVSGSRGSDNHLVADRETLLQLLADKPAVRFLIQAYIPNTSDYRVWVCGDTTGPVLFRSRQSGHLNNTSLGGEATLLEGSSVLPEKVIADCIRAAQLLQRDLAGVDVVFADDNVQGEYYFFEVNRAPQIEDTPYEEVKARALAEFMTLKIKEKKS